MKLLDVGIRPREAGGITVTLSGELDLSTLDRLKEALDGIDGKPELVVLDLRQLGFLDSSGLRLMLGLHASLEEAGGQLVLVRGPRRVHRVLELTRATEELNIVDDPAAVDGQPDFTAEAG